MFLRFTKGKFSDNNVRLFRKCVFLEDSLVMEYGNRIVGIAKKSDEFAKSDCYHITVAGRCEIGPACMARYIKDMIGKSNKFSETPSIKRRRYVVEVFDGEELPVKAKIVFD